MKILIKVDQYLEIVLTMFLSTKLCLVQLFIQGVGDIMAKLKPCWHQPRD